MYERLPGFRDFYPEDRLRRDYLFRLWAQTARKFAFQAYDIPTLEPLELYQAKNEELSDQLFSFIDKGERPVVLRPELTRSLARMVGARAGSLRRPIKWYNIAENFRYEKPQKGRLRSHYQLNADILGESDPAADAEIITLCLESLRVFGLGPSHLVLRLSDRQLWGLFLTLWGREAEGAALLSVVDRLEKWTRPELLERLRPLLGAEAETFLDQVQTLVQGRDLEAIRAFFAARGLTAAQQGVLETRLADWARLLADLEASGVGDLVRVDLGIVRGLNYYTGFVFEVFELAEDGRTTGRALAGGGRYDNLVGSLGYGDLPAVGFGMGDVTVADLLEERGLLPTLVNAPDLFMVVGGEAERRQALQDAALLRGRNLVVECPLKPSGFGKQFKAAGQSGASLALIYGSEELAQQKVRVKDLRSGGEADLPRLKLVETLHELLSEGLPAPESPS